MEGIGSVPLCTGQTVWVAVDSLHDLQKALDDLTDQDYMELSEQARKVGAALRDGAYLKAALSKLK